MFIREVEAVHPDLLKLNELVFKPLQVQCSAPVKDAESAAYGAYTFKLGKCAVVFRVAKITPKKVGQFVTFWKRIGKEAIQPFDFLDPVDFFIVTVRKDDYFGQFIFPKSVLVAKKILSVGNKGGKRAIRVYPPWDKAINQAAKKTQQWQLDYFLDIPPNKPIDYDRAQILYGVK